MEEDRIREAAKEIAEELERSIYYGDHASTAYTSTATTEEYALTMDGFIATVFGPTLDRLKEAMTEKLGVNFETHSVVLSDELCEELGIIIPRPNPLRDDIMSSPFLEGFSFLVIEKPKPFMMSGGRSSNWGIDSFARFDKTRMF